MKTVTLSCDGCQMQAPGTIGQTPSDWFDVQCSGWGLGTFCPKCAKSVNVPKFMEKLRAERNGSSGGNDEGPG